ncbi:MAG: Rpn family recombination-promoting nuclease/putative transposase [Lachnospiraceae bacterium]|nr:Rpn family recombination-promoting nuclease/putative transposase [Lachnospiraceae bacterium]
MGKIDVGTNTFMGEPARIADLLNGFVYRGEERVKAEEVHELRNVLNRQEHGDSVQTVTADVVTEVGKDMHTLIVVLENQTDIHYAMPVRMMNLEAMGYHRQWRKAAGAHAKNKDLEGSEYLSGFAKEEKLKPMLPIVLYFGKEVWNGPKNLRDMMDIEGYPQEICALLTDYPLHLIEVRRYEEYENFHTDLREVFGFLQRAEDKEKLREYLRDNEKAFENLSTDAYDMISIMGHSQELQAIREKYHEEKGGKSNMCQAIKDMIEDGRQEGVQIGNQEGRIQEYIDIRREDNYPDDTIRAGIIVRFHLSEEAADQYMNYKTL